MTDLRKAAERALEVLEDIFGKEKKDVGAINALRQALEHSEKETFTLDRGCYERGCVAYDERDGDAVNISAERVDETAKREHEPVGYVTDSGMSAVFIRGINLEDDTPLYTAPPKREWVGLTDEEKYDVLESATGDGGRVYYDTLFRSYEAKLKEKNAND